ncbi:FAD-dependent monooxygenase [Streptomyces sp. NPDC096205]|uniref:FAD-dependent monooxygenase n=1 Tax=Streptomyces sp. NPDC096205 TaxID=3366081 RepID=UPI0037FAFC18
MTETTRAAGTARVRRAVIIGGGLAGMLAAAAVQDSVTETVILERDVLPARPERRKGLPQAQHAHLLWAGGAEAIETLLPGMRRSWLEAGARRISLPTGLVSLTAQGWFRRWQETQYMIACSRDLLDWAVRIRVLALPGVSLLERTELLELTGSASRMTGVRYRDSTGSEQHLEADLVVDASGRGSRAPVLLNRLGIYGVREKQIDSGLVYATRIFRAPADSSDFPLVNVQSNAREPRPGQSATIVPIEGHRWLVTLSGTRGGEPSGDPEAFEDFARSVRHPVVAELIAGAEPLTDVVVSRSTVNRRRYFESVRHWPDGFVVLGDAVASYNPVYGHGMSVAAQGAVALRHCLHGSSLDARGLARRVQRAVARPVSVAWNLSTGQDIFYPDVTGGSPTVVDRVLGRYVDRLQQTATGSFRVSAALVDVMTLQAPVTRLVRPDVVLAAVRGPLRPPLDRPPLTHVERAVATRHARSASAGTDSGKGLDDSSPTPQ